MLIQEKPIISQWRRQYNTALVMASSQHVTVKQEKIPFQELNMFFKMSKVLEVML